MRKSIGIVNLISVKDRSGSWALLGYVDVEVRPTALILDLGKPESEFLPDKPLIEHFMC